ncbi:phosphonate C-P lyase system protein PhnH (plasmid) [Sinorhizobium meliloti WSM1022]|jgi:alpha-D-ribose 1-methylphosphonate 5-triphosphate synthase subunit PhnH|uniref:phosphonate C-P lyase system protein PhnH n=1 Tax=Rhizobium meliloti TaxID=382 RepID=UPI00031C446F|nr:phosphonate C-P lyase system protein PhnH [Sinorhizobium meliloti]AIM02708.1 protein phnH [Sinorhizobium meliloti]ASQ08142.1 carbon-phosphorus lyase subunit PhnH [Sinorhizobium meliloti]MCM5688192.1 phosphonate C-P lyase system protein PhnH [Sinorhizobium meliloti]MCO5964751.1 phosphonate C-P lyase system protein PhnH [Sinorhizobium meliloti]MCO6423585.1 phosphonate C-P lyase system protein PhnH [Sinorhizobium meliloti]
MTAQSQIYSGAFADPVFEAQSVFRSLMDCFARPGIIGRLSTVAAPPAPLGEASGAVALTLCDHDTPVWLSPALSKSSAPKWIAFHTGAGVTDTKDEPRFAFFEKGAAVPGFDQFALGTQEYPDRSTTLVVEVEALEGGQPLIGRGPGIKNGIVIAPKGLPDVFLDLWAANRAIFPRGIDLVLTAREAVLCLPRTTKLERE